jgi:hypothetical protein
LSWLAVLAPKVLLVRRASKVLRVSLENKDLRVPKASKDYQENPLVNWQMG